MADKKDIRLYSFDGNGNIRKVGEYKTDRKKFQRHFFESVIHAMTRVESLIEAKRYKKGTQFLIIEYFPKETNGQWSRIVELINT